MTRYPGRLFLFLALFCTALLIQPAHAEQPSVSTTLPGQLVIDLPDVDQDALIDALQTLRSQLIDRKQMLVKRVEDRKPDGGDALVTAIMPGGLLYAGYKKARYEQAMSDLAMVMADIEELAGDLLAMQSGPEPVIVAQLP